MTDLLSSSGFWTAAAAVVVALISGWFAHRASAEKVKIDANSALVQGFIDLLAEFKTERRSLMDRVSELEGTNRYLERRVHELEIAVTKAGGALPPVEGGARA